MRRSQQTRRSRFRRALVLALASSACIACRGPATAPEAEPRTVEAGQFVFFAHEGVSHSDVMRILDALGGNAGRIRSHLRVTSMPRVRVGVWSQAHKNDWNRAMQAATGRISAGATGYTPAADEMRLLLDPSSPQESVHEYAHLVSIQRVGGTSPTST